VAGAAVYWIAVMLFQHTVVGFLYGGKYMNVGRFIPLVALASILRIAATSQAIALRAIQSPSLVFVAYCASAVVGVLVAVPAIWAFGIIGALVAAILSNATALVVASLLLRYQITTTERVLA
jgi:O-antigen/teichoic acid export membrane protein